MNWGLIIGLIVIGFVLFITRPSKTENRAPRVPSAAERCAEWERRRGEHRAQQRLRDECRLHRFDALAAARVRPAFRPRLPGLDRERAT